MLKQRRDSVASRAVFEKFACWIRAGLLDSAALLILAGLDQGARMRIDGSAPRRLEGDVHLNASVVNFEGCASECEFVFMEAVTNAQWKGGWSLFKHSLKGGWPVAM